jgi:hypothetical protein
VQLGSDVPAVVDTAVAALTAVAPPSPSVMGLRIAVATPRLRPSRLASVSQASDDEVHSPHTPQAGC